MFVNLGGKRQRPYLTMLPLAGHLGLEVDTSCDRDDEDCVDDAVKDYDGPGNILIWSVLLISTPCLWGANAGTWCSWEHDALNKLAEEIGVKDQDNYPDDSYDIIWTQPYPYKDITESSENCPGLDD